MKAFYFWIGTSSLLLLGALFFKNLPVLQGWMLTLFLLALVVGFMIKLCRGQ
jgi:hypothetical protein